MLARAIEEAMQSPPVADAPFIFVGFWTDKGTCDEATTAVLQKLEGKKVFLFGTAGFDGGENYYADILNKLARDLPASNTVAGTFMCQGKMPAAVRQRYEKTLAENPDDTRAKAMIKSFDNALSHPNKSDIERLKSLVVWLAAGEAEEV